MERLEIFPIDQIYLQLDSNDLFGQRNQTRNQSIREKVLKLPSNLKRQFVSPYLKVFTNYKRI